LIDEGDDAFPTRGEYRGVPLFMYQSARRITDVVEPELDQVIAMRDLAELADWAADPARCPEGRVLAGNKAIEILRGVGDTKRRRPRGLSIQGVAASFATAGSRLWANPYYHCGDIEIEARAAKREVPLPCPPFTG
jgi:hypothetical protein